MEISVVVPVHHSPPSNLGNLDTHFLMLLERAALAGPAAEWMNKLLGPEGSEVHPSPARLLPMLGWHRCPLVPVW